VQPSNRRDPVGFDWRELRQLIAAIQPDFELATAVKTPTPGTITGRSYEGGPSDRG
jgi:hypothetical protein